MKYSVRKDKYTKARGGSSQFLLIRCARCKEPIALYQKDGPGPLLRMYVDKFHAPEELVSQAQSVYDKSDLHGLHCPSCETLLAVPMVYEKENRLAYRILRGTVHTQKSDGVYPPDDLSEDD